VKWNSIRSSILAAMAACLIVGVIGTLMLLRHNFAQNSHALAVESVDGAQRLFSILEARETAKMVDVSDALATNPEVRDALAARDRGRLLGLTAGLYSQLNADGITNWMFHTTEPDMSVFLRLHNPAKFGDRLNRRMDNEVVRTHAIVAGNELARAGFAARMIRPVYDSNGQVIGYIEFGEEIGRFIHEMKSQTGDDYGLLLSKKFVDRRFWADTSASLHRRDNWDDHSTFVVADSTSASDRIIRFDGDLSAIGTHGEVLERFDSRESAFVRGLFPIYDSSHNTAGAMFVQRDISGIYTSMRNAQLLLAALSVLGLVFGCGLTMMMLSHMVFNRMPHVVTVAMRLGEISKRESDIQKGRPR